MPSTCTRLPTKVITEPRLGNLLAREMEIGELATALHVDPSGKRFNVSGTKHMKGTQMNLATELKEGGSRGSSLSILARTNSIFGSHLTMALASFPRSVILLLSAVHQLPSI